VAGSLEGPAAKLARAESQFAVLQDEIESLWPDKPWPVEAKPHRGGLEYRFYLGELPSVEPAWALIAGEIMFNLRCALDHLIWELHVRHFRDRTLPKGVETASQFPIFDSPAKFRANGVRRIESLSERDRRAIRFLQPYIRRNDEWSSIRRDLGDLNALHNIDKHRKLHVVASVQRFAVVPHFAGVGFDFQPKFGPVESGDHIDTWTFTQPPAKMHEHEGAHLEVVLEQPGHERGLIELLDELVVGVSVVLSRFADRFPPSPHFPPIDF
jgi:hypothetical protein